jgi:hypothetical protein
MPDVSTGHATQNIDRRRGPSARPPRRTCIVQQAGLRLATLGRVRLARRSATRAEAVRAHADLEGRSTTGSTVLIP